MAAPQPQLPQEPMIVITGTPGWMGTQLARQLHQAGKKVRALVLPSVDDSPLKNCSSEIFKGDITRPDTLRGLCAGASTVVHCAGIIHPKRAQDYFRVNFQGTVHVLNEALKAGVQKFVYISSSSAGSGENQSRASTEADPPSPYKLYGKSKLMAEEAIKEAVKKSKAPMTAVILRPHFLYGEGGPRRQIQLIQMVSRPRPIVFGRGNNTHSLCNIKNCLDALMKAVDFQGTGAETFYIADEKPYSILDVYKTIADSLKVSIRPRHLPLPPEDSFLYAVMDQTIQWSRFFLPQLHLSWDWSKNISSDITKAKRLLHYNPRHELKDGFREAIEDYLSRKIKLTHS